MEEIEDFDVREFVEALERFGGKGIVERNARVLPAPQIIFRVMGIFLHEANGLNLLDHRETLPDATHFHPSREQFAKRHAMICSMRIPRSFYLVMLLTVSSIVMSAQWDGM